VPWRRLASFATLCWLLASAAPAHAQPASFTADEERRLAAGEVLTRFWREGRSGAGAGWAAGVVDATPGQVFQVIADVARYKEFTDRMVESRVVERRGDRYRFYYRIRMPWPLADHECTTDNVHEVDAARRVYARRWKLVAGTFHRNDGAWIVRPWGKGSAQALLIYQVVLLPKTAAPRAVLDYVTRVALPRSVQAMRRRVVALKKAGRL
jgi:ribosome-associated toxin RatA of RatAB toxin-antitoxin module